MTADTREPLSIGDLVAELRCRFEAHQIEGAHQDARLLVGGILDLGLTELVLHTDRLVGDHDIQRIHAAADRRCAGEPVHRILGRREFHGLDLLISPATLEPRPDTETLVDAVMPIGRDVAQRKGDCRILDLGTGTGAIGLALLAGISEATCVATDISDEALTTAESNAERLGFSDRFSPLLSDWFQSVQGSFDLIVSNPPYIRTAVIAGLAREVREHDPVAALDGGTDGLSAYRKIASGAEAHLRPDAHVAVEIGFDQRLDVTALFDAQNLVCRSQVKDLGGRDRALVFALGDQQLPQFGSRDG